MAISTFGRLLCAIALGLPLAACAAGGVVTVGRSAAPELPVTRWDHRPEAPEWTRSTLLAVEGHGAGLVSTVPADIAEFCPAYDRADARQRGAFWVGFMSALAKHESTWNPAARGGGGQWIGLMQISPATARAYGCRAETGDALLDGSANLSCAVRIMASQVGRDAAIVSDGSKGWRGVARDWAPLRVSTKRADIAAWTRTQDYCQAQG